MSTDTAPWMPAVGDAAVIVRSGPGGIQFIKTVTVAKVMAKKIISDNGWEFSRRESTISVVNGETTYRMVGEGMSWTSTTSTYLAACDSQFVSKARETARTQAMRPKGSILGIGRN